MGSSQKRKSETEHEAASNPNRSFKIEPEVGPSASRPTFKLLSDGKNHAPEMVNETLEITKDESRPFVPHSCSHCQKIILTRSSLKRLPYSEVQAHRTARDGCILYIHILDLMEDMRSGLHDYGSKI
jgi:hypothetical protein